MSQNLIKSGTIFPQSVTEGSDYISIEKSVPIDASFEVTFHLPNYLIEENVVKYNIHICGTETVQSKGSIFLTYDEFGIGVASVIDTNKMSEVYISSHDNCPIEPI